VRVGDASVRVLERNPGRPGQAVVMIHGLPGTAHDFDDVAALLPDRRTIAYDRPGFGFSDGGYHDFDEQVRTLAGLLHALGAPRPILVGHSYGGTLALAFAARHPEAVGGLVLVDAAAGGQESEWTDRMQSRLVQALSVPVVEEIADATFSHVLRTVSAKLGDAEAFEPGEVDASHEDRLLALNMQHDDLDAYASEQLAADDVIAALDRRLGSIEAPAVVIQGEDDALVRPERGRRIAAALPNARLAMVGGGHMATYVHPNVVAAAVRELLRAARLPRRERATSPAASR
jgi:pimeloyl-ACP methyl ester carboxylesterase